MPGRTLDAIILDLLGLKELTIARLQWQIEELQSQLAAKNAEVKPSADAEHAG